MSWGLIQNSLWLGGGAAILASLFGATVALAITTGPRALRVLLFSGTVVAAATPGFLFVNVWLESFGPEGSWNGALPFDAFSLPSAVVLSTGAIWPWIAILLAGTWSRLDLRALEVEPRLTGFRTIRHALYPAAKSTLAFAIAVAFTLGLNQFDIPTLLQVAVFPSEVWIRFNTFLDAWGAAVVGWPLVALPIGALWLGARMEPITWPTSGRATDGSLLRNRLGNGVVVPLWIGGALLVAATAVGPYALLMINGDTWSQLVLAVQAGSGAGGRSALYAVLAGVLAACVAVGIWNRRLASIAWLFWLAPGTLLAILQVQFLSSFAPRWLYPSLGVAIVGLTLRYGVLAWMVVRVTMRQIPSAWSDALSLCGANAVERFRWVHWPHAKHGIVLGALVVYLFAIWDTETLLFLAPPGGETLSTRIFNLLHYGHVGQVNALCLLATALALAPACLWWAWRTLRSRGSRVPIFWVAAPSLILAGCGGPSGATSSNESRTLSSRFFANATVIGARGVAPGQFNKPRSLAIGLDDSLYVIDLTGRLQKLTRDGTFVDQWTLPDLENGRPKGMAREIGGDIIVVEPHYSRINHFDPFLRLQFQWGTMGLDVGELRLPRDIVQTSDGRYWISEYGHHDRVQVFSNDRQRAEMTIGAPGSEDGQFSRPEGLGVDRQDRVFVADSCNHRIQVFDSQGAWIASYGEAGSGLGQLSYPYDICVDRAGFQYVCEFGGNRIQVFDPQFQPVEIIGGRGGAPGEFDQPWCVALDSDENLYVADSRNHRLQVWRRRANAPTGSESANHQLASSP